MSWDFFNIIAVFGGLQGILLAILFLSSEKFSKTSNQFLALNLITISLSNILGGLKYAGASSLYPIINFLPLTWYFLIPVTLYYFILFLLKPSYKIQRREYWLFAPFVLQLLVQLYYFGIYFVDNENLQAYWPTMILLDNILEFSAILYSLVLFILTYRMIGRFQEDLLNQYANLENKSVTWLKTICLAIFVLWACWFLSFFYFCIGSDYSRESMNPVFLGISIVIYWLGYSTYSRKDLFEVPKLVSNGVVVEKNNSSLSQKTEQHYQNLLSIMEQEKLYRDPNLSMSILAQKLDLSNGYLSQIINQKEGKNFFDFVNTYRVEAVKNILTDPAFEHYSILGIAHEAGFKSKSTFNAVFKKMTGKTPSAYKKNLA